MSNFKKGDRVRMISTLSWIPLGEIGTVIDAGGFNTISWDKPSRHSRQNYGYKNVWNVNYDHLELVEDIKKDNIIYEIY